jgi:hypothetical protein
MTKSIFKEPMFYFTLSIVLLFNAAISLGFSIHSKNKKPPYDKIINVCEFEINKLDNHNALKFDHDKSYAIDTSNPNVWLVHLVGSAKIIDKNQDEAIRISCQIYQKDGNFQGVLLNASPTNKSG